MKAYARSLRIAPKKANLIAKMVRGMPVPAAMESLRRTNKKAARMVEQLLKSAVANASHNDKQDVHLLVIKTIIVNQGSAYRRGIPRARGSVRPIRKFLSHISLTLGIADHDAPAKKPVKAASKASQKAKNPVQSAGSKKKGGAASKAPQNAASDEGSKSSSAA